MINSRVKAPFPLEAPAYACSDSRVKAPFPLEAPAYACSLAERVHSLSVSVDSPACAQSRRFQEMLLIILNVLIQYNYTHVTSEELQVQVEPLFLKNSLLQ